MYSTVSLIKAIVMVRGTGVEAKVVNTRAWLEDSQIVPGHEHGNEGGD